MGHVLDVVAEAAPDSVALIVGAERRRITFADLLELVVEHCGPRAAHERARGDGVHPRREGPQRGDQISWRPFRGMMREEVGELPGPEQL